MYVTRQKPLRTGRLMPEVQGKQSDLGYLFAAAVVNSQFRQLLLENPESALKNGYQGQPFELSLEEHDQVLSASACSLADLAKTMMNS